MCSNEFLEFGDERVLATKGEVRLDPGLERRQSELLEACDLGLGEGLEGEVGQGTTTPECERIPKRRRCPLCLTPCELPPTLLQQRLETVDVELVWWNPQRVARGVRDKELFAGLVGKESPQPREIDAQDRVDRLWGRIPPELLDQSLARDRLVRVQDEQAEERSLFRATEGEGKCLPAPDDLERPEDAELEIRMPLRGSIVRPSSCEWEPSIPFARCIGRVWLPFSPELDRCCVRNLQNVDRLGGPILLSLVVALVLVPSASAYEVPSKVNEVARVYSLGVGEVRCPSREEWDQDWASSFGWAYTDVRKDYTVLGPVVCTGALGVGSSGVPLWQQALGALILTHEAFHLRHWRFRRNEGKVECQALANFRDAARRLGASTAQAEDLYPYALALHDYKVRLFPQYRDPKCVIPPWAPPTTTG